MKSIIRILLLTLIATSLSALEPSKVAYYTNNTSAQNVYVELKDYSTNTMLFRGETFSLTPNDNGIVIVDVNDYPAGGATGDWSGINASVINTSTMLDIYVNGTLFSQKRYDNLILVQAEATVLDNSGNFNPQTLNGTIGTDDNRWDDVFVGGNTLHIGPNDGDANNTEMELSYSGNTGTISINNTNVITATTSTVSTNNNLSVGGNIDFTSATGTILNSTFGAIGIGDNLTLINDADLILDNNSRILSPGGVVTVHDDLSVTAGNLLVSTLAGAGNRIVTANTTGVLSAGTALPAGTIVGTTDTQTLTNKSIDADNNTITNIDNADIKAGAAIDATKLADGSITSTELQYINTVTSNVQTQLNSKQGIITAGDGLSFTTSTLNVGGSTTIISNANDLEVNSSATANEILLSSGTVGTAATYGALPLGDANSVSGTLSVANGGTGATTLATGNFLQGNGTGAITATKAIPTGAVLGTTDTQTLTNKTIDADNNTITNIENADIKAGAAIDATKLADGTVTSTELQYINSVTSNVQTQLDGKQANLPSQTGNSGQYLTTDGTNLSWGTVSGGSTVSTNSTINGDGSGGSPLGINLGNSNTWTGAQTFHPSSSVGVIIDRTHLALVNSDNTARQIRFQESSGNGTNYVSFEAANNLSGNSNYKLTTDGTNGQVLTTDGSGNLTWTTPSGGGGNNGFTYTEVSGNTTIGTDDQIIYILGDHTVTFPDPPRTGQMIYIFTENVDATLDPGTKKFRDNGTDYGISDMSDFGGVSQYELTLYYNGTKWLPIGR